MPVVPFPDPLHQRDRTRWTEPEEREAGGKMSFLEHLDEFRKRLINSLIAVGIGMGISFFFINRIFEFIMVPLQRMLPEGGHLIATEPTEPFMLYLKIALLAGIVIASPAIMLQVWLFVAPGLYSNEKRFAVPFILLLTIGFVLGAAFAHYIVFPLMWRYFASFQTEYMLFTPKIDAVFSLYVRMMLAMGLVFEMPTVVFALARMGVVTARWLLRNLKYAVLVNFIIAAVITPSPDPFSQTMVAGPMCGLYLISILIAWTCGKRHPPAEA